MSLEGLTTLSVAEQEPQPCCVTGANKVSLPKPYMVRQNPFLNLITFCLFQMFIVNHSHRKKPSKGVQSEFLPVAGVYTTRGRGKGFACSSESQLRGHLGG